MIDVNDNSPQFSDSTYYGSVTEMAELNSVVMVVFATDADQQVNNHINAIQQYCDCMCADKMHCLDVGGAFCQLLKNRLLAVANDRQAQYVSLLGF